MSLQKLPQHVQSLFSASFQICSYKRAIEELVFNALDADSTSIAIRINIVKNTIQVIDNGCGISKKNFGLLGQKYATSKCMDLSNLQSVPNKYGFRGLALSSIIDISESVNITSRYRESGKTFVKYYFKGKEINVTETSLRPSKGTTVDIRGFLYNLKIQRKAVNALLEVNNIKLFLEQLSLLQNNISLSLRDDAKNEIVFKIHKNRDIYQTLSSAYGLHKNEIQELKVEKNEYKVTAYMAKKYIEIIPLHWIYLNGKILTNSKIHNIVDENLTKHLKLTSRRKPQSKSNRIFDEEEANKHNNVPTYFLFLNCPYYDYDISYNLKQTTVEFKNWDHMKKILEKLIKFYVGDGQNKEIIHAVDKEKVVNKEDNDTRDQVKKIMDKILGCNPKKTGTLQMQKVVKGKLTKRKLNKNSRKITSTNVTDNLQINQLTKSKRIKPAIEDYNKSDENVKTDKKNTIARLFPKTVTNTNKNESNINNKNNFNLNHRYSNSKRKQSKTKKLKRLNCNKVLKKETNQNVQTKKVNLTKYNDLILAKFEQDPTGSLKRRCDALSKKVENIMNQKKREKREIFVNETVHYSNITKDNKKYSVREKINEIIIHDYIPLRPQLNQISSCYKTEFKNRKQGFVSSHDLLKTILSTQDPKNNLLPLSDNTISKKSKLMSVVDDNDGDFVLDSLTFHCSSINASQAIQEDTMSMPKFTYNSHNYKTDYNSQTGYRCNVKDTSNFNKKPKFFQFMSTKSRDNFITSSNKRPKRQTKNYNKVFYYRSKPGLLSKILNNSNRNESSYTIEFSKNSGNMKNNFFDIQQKNSAVKSNSHFNKITTNELCTYTIEHDNKDKHGYTYHLTDNGTLFNYQNIYGSVNERNFLKENINVHNLTHDDTFYSNEYIHDDVKDQNVSKENTNVNNLTHDDTLHQCQNIYDDIKDQNCSKENTNMDNLIYDDTFLSNANIYDDVKDQNVSKENTNVNNLTHDDTLHQCQNIYDDIKDQNCSKENTNMDNLIYDDTLHSNANIYDDVKDQNASNENTNINNLTYDYILHKCQNVYDDINDQNCLKENANIDNLTYDDTLHNYQNVYDDLIDQNHSKENINVVFISKSQEETVSLNETLNPLDICETELNESVKMLENTQLKSNNGNDSLFKDEFELESQFCDRNIYSSRPCLRIEKTQENNIIMENNITNIEEPKFVLKYRPRFVPKGMSQIFKMSRTKPCDSESISNYFGNTIYCNFAEDIKSNAEIYEPVVQNVKDMVTKAIGKVSHKLKKDNAALIFDGFSLKHAKVLGQVDSKFIAAIMRNKDQNHREYFVLFDQHAVHERIRLENYLKIYFDGVLWKSVALKENVHIKLSKDDLLYLYNYEDKFKQLGLQWTIEDEENVLVKGIPEAIMGKNERQVEVIIKAVRNLFLEEIATIKLQSGCITKYPKAIMDFVFSEACRYAYKFGDKLYMDDCVQLLQSLSECKTPFQCAHGRPVMAVIMDIKGEEYSYEVDVQNIRKWKNAQKR